MQALRCVPADGDLLTRSRPLSSQAVCAIFEKSVKTLLDDFAPMVPQLCEMLGRMYSTIPQASALDLTRQVGLRCHPRRRSDPGMEQVAAWGGGGHSGRGPRLCPGSVGQGLSGPAFSALL